MPILDLEMFMEQIRCYIFTYVYTSWYFVYLKTDPLAVPASVVGKIHQP